jgi:hypothetical protein
MKKTVLSMLVLVATVSAASAAPMSLPFPVKVGGQDAKVDSDTAFAARVDGAVTPDAPIEVTANSPQVIVNVMEADEKGQPIAGKPTSILLLANGKGALSGTMDKKPLGPGRYLASLVADGKTARVVFTIK